MMGGGDFSSWQFHWGAQIAVNSLTGSCSWRNREKKKKKETQGASYVFSVMGDWAENGCLKQYCGSETIKVGEKTLHPWQPTLGVRAADPAKPRWFTEKLSVQIISCVSLMSESFSKSKALLQECRVQMCMKGKKSEQINIVLWLHERSPYKTSDAVNILCLL